MNQEERKTAIRRMRVLVAAACILMLLYGLRLIFLQLVNGEDFKIPGHQHHRLQVYGHGGTR